MQNKNLLQSSFCASLPMLMSTTEAVDYSYEMMSRSILPAYRRPVSDIKGICHQDSQAYQIYWNSTLRFCFTLKRAASKENIVIKHFIWKSYNYKWWDKLLISKSTLCHISFWKMWFFARLYWIEYKEYLVVVFSN